MDGSNTKEPIFIHSLWRTNSTYWWNKFRENSDCECFYEPFHPDIDVQRKQMDFLRHPKMERPAFAEYGDNSIPLVFQNSPKSLKPYYLASHQSNEVIENYIGGMLSASKEKGKRAVLKFVRSPMRVPFLKNKFSGAHHIYLHRDLDSIMRSNDSFKDNYYHANYAMVVGLNADALMFKELAEYMNLPHEDFQTFNDTLKHYLNKVEDKEFYDRQRMTDCVGFFWVMGAILGAKHADFILDNEALKDKTGQKAVQTKLRELTGIEVDMADYRYQPPPAKKFPISKKGKEIIKHAISIAGIEPNELPALLEKFSPDSKQQLADALEVPVISRSPFSR